MKAARTASDKKYYFSARKLILPVFLLSAVIWWILMIVMGVSIFVSNIRNHIIKADNLEQAVLNTYYASYAISDNQDSRIRRTIHFLHAYQVKTGAPDQELVTMCRDFILPSGVFVIDKDGNITTEDNRMTETVIQNSSPQKRLELIRNAVNSVTNEADSRVYSEPLDSGSTLCIETEDSRDPGRMIVISTQEAVDSIARQSGKLGRENRHAMVVDESSGEVIAWDETDEAAELFTSIRESDLSYYELDETHSCTVNVVNGVLWVTMRKVNDSMGFSVYYSSALIGYIQNRGLNWAIRIEFTLLFVIISFFFFYLRQYAWIHSDNQKYSPGIQKRKSAIAALIGAIFIALVTYYTETLFLVSEIVLYDQDELSQIESYSEDSNRRSNYLITLFKDQVKEDTSMAARYLEKSPDAWTRDSLDNLCVMLNSRYMILYDTDGNEICGSGRLRNYSFPDDPEDPAYAYRKLKNGKSEVILDNLDDEITGSRTIRGAFSLFDEEGEPIGFLEAAYDSERLQELLGNSSLGILMETVNLRSATSYVVLNMEGEHPVIEYCPWFGYSSDSVSRLGFTEESMKDRYFGKLTINNAVSYVTGVNLGKRMVFIVHPQSQVYADRLGVSVVSAVLMVTGLLLVSYILDRKRKKYSRIIYASKKEEQMIQAQYRAAMSGKTPAGESEEETEAEMKPETALDRIHLSWLMMRPEQKLTMSVQMIAAGFTVYVFVRYFLNSVNESGATMLTRILSGEWSKGWNIFAFTANLIILLQGYLIAGILREILVLIGKVSDAQGETICRLLRSAVQYTTIIAVIYLMLVNFGLDPSALVTSAGLIGVAIGIGARDLITDIVAGLFIIFEKEFQVGDVIEVSGYQGMVHEIGIRTTKVRGWDNNEKVINNRNMINVINMTTGSSYAVINFGVPYTVSIDRLEEIFRKEFETYNTKYPELIGVPRFNGIIQFSGKIECSVIAEVPELARGALRRKLSRDIKNILDQNGIPMV
ncbi:MAG: mechanosensitive ion channel [Solobacterium sp.]|nr:mechanosensitive ion channel [Solobacterium sp.]